MHVAVATSREIPALCELLAILFAQELEFGSDPVRQARGLEVIIADPSVGLILTLRDDTGIIGMVNLLFTMSTYLGAPVALLEDLIVHPAHRGKGGGTVLLQAAKECAVERGCQRITLLTDASNCPARAFYEKMGFIASNMTPYRLALSDSPPTHASS